MGSNMAENHPVGFQWVMEAKERGAKVVHIDPRFTRTSAVADTFVPLRPGTDIAFLGGLIHHVLEHGHEMRDYVLAYTNASHVLHEDVRLPDDLDGYFSGYDPESGYDDATWQYEGDAPPVHAAAGSRHNVLPGDDEAEDEATAGDPDHLEEGGEAFEGGSIENVHHIERDDTLTHPRSVFQLLKRHYARYTPERVADTCGIDVDTFLAVAEAVCANSGRERTTSLVYSVGWTQHTVGVQYIRAASILQLLLGNIGRPGGGILALRGHASIQGSTDVPTLYDLLPGYLPMPSAGAHDDLETYERRTTAVKGYWSRTRTFLASLLTAWWGEHAQARDDLAFGYLPRITGDHGAYRTFLDMLDGDVEGYFLFGQNPAVGSANSRLHRLALGHLDWLVVRDLTMIESATFWKDGPEVTSGELDPSDIGTEVFFLPAAAHVEKDGTFTNTQRLLQWHDAAVTPKGDARSDLWFVYHLGRRIREKLAARDGDTPPERDLPIHHLTWDYPTEGPHDEPSAEAVLAEINGYDADGQPLSSFEQLADDGSTSCGVWIYCGAYADGVNQTARRTPWTQMGPAAQQWGWAWPADRRMLYSRASADPDGNPWSQRKRYIWWDADEQRWTGLDTPDFDASKPPDHQPDEDATGVEALGGTDAFLMQADGKGWLWAPSGLADGPLPMHLEPHESPVRNPLHPVQANPLRERHPRGENPDNPGVDGQDDLYPYVATTYRIAEHHTAGGMSRFGTRLAELAREMFVEVHPSLAAERGLTHGGWATIVTSRSAIEARVLVTERMQPLTVGGRQLHQVGLPYHWGHAGSAPGDAANDLFPIVLDPNVHIQEVKAATCDIVPGRRPRRPATFVDDHARDPERMRTTRRSQERT